MVDIGQVALLAEASFRREHAVGGGFYGAADGMAIGAGIIAAPIRYPLFNASSHKFETVEGAAYVLTHECDIDAGNIRHFNDHFVICPVIPLESLVAAYDDDGSVTGLVDAIAGNKVHRVFYLPPYSVDGLRNGGVLYLNQLASTHVSLFEITSPRNLCALSSYGQRSLDWKLENHFKRPKAEELPRVAGEF